MTPEDSYVVSISSNSSLNPDEIARRSFPAARRGVDEEAVKQYLGSLANEVRALLEREKELRRKLAEAERRAAEPEIDEGMLAKAVGVETAKILQTAHDAAHDVVEKADARAREITAAAEQHLATRTAEAEGTAEAILVAAEEEASAMRSTAAEEAESLREAAREEAHALSESARTEHDTLMESTKQKCQDMVREAFDLRTSVLRDLAERRKTLYVQLEQLRSGRDSLVEVVDAVAGAVDDLRERLANAEHDARVAAAEAGERAENEEDADLELELAVDEGLAVDFAPAFSADDLAGASATHASAAPVDVTSEAGEEGSPAAVAEAEGEAPEPSAATRRSVDELFAKIRSTRSEASGVLGGSSAHDAAVNEAEEDAVVEGAEPPAGGDAAALAKRTELLAPVMTKLKRAVKRALQDDQNGLLDAIRNSSGAPDLEKLLPEQAQLERFSAVFEPMLGEAFVAGTGWLGGTGKAASGDGAGLQLAKELALELSSQLRHRLSESLASAPDLADPAVQDGAGAAYREWKTPRIEGISADFAVMAFSRGAVANSAGVKVRWVVDDDGKPCPDCDDNALAGPQPVGEAFPTGQTHPPVHPGCRCLLVAAD